MTGARVHNLTFHGVGEPPRELAARRGGGVARTSDALPRGARRGARPRRRAALVRRQQPLRRRRGAARAARARADRDVLRARRPARRARPPRRRATSGGCVGRGHEDRLARPAPPRLAARSTTSELAARAGRLAPRSLERVAGRARRPTRRCPFGSYDRRVLARVRRDGGYARVFTSDGGTARARRLAAAAHRRSRRPTRPARWRRAPRAGRRARARAAKRLVKRWR